MCIKNCSRITDQLSRSRKLTKEITNVIWDKYRVLNYVLLPTLHFADRSVWYQLKQVSYNDFTIIYKMRLWRFKIIITFYFAKLLFCGCPRISVFTHTPTTRFKHPDRFLILAYFFQTSSPLRVGIINR